ncbi:hypothetical protein [Pararhodonellum marinum]|uniref:hypothetical protein n=1 Tax=Pararhodonellum marinum TaxID=2755358 RepID=UPI00188ED43E|nr:hypothetical protein [Pararhodonellum marinum]
MKRILFFKIILFFCVNTVYSQVFTNKEVGQRNLSRKDSLKNVEYPYSLPIWGAKATNAGYSLPYSAGLSVQYFWQESDIIIENLMVGFNNGQLHELDEFVRFNKAVATASAVSVRPDIWLFPFLNIYSVLGKTSASTDIGFGLWLPDGSNNYNEVFSAGTKVDFNATTFGIGMTPTIGVGGGFLALDMNVAWTDVPQLATPARTFVFGPRFGKNFRMKKPESSIAVWVGGFRVQLNSETNGSILLSEVFPPGTLGGRIDEGKEKVENAFNQVENWWNGLSQLEQNNPINRSKYEKANSILDRASQFLVAADGAVSTIETSTVQYTMDKRPKDMWNFIVGTQYQFNKHLMLRLEYGFLSSREQLITGLQYRFGL